MNSYHVKKVEKTLNQNLTVKMKEKFSRFRNKSLLFQWVGFRKKMFPANTMTIFATEKNFQIFFRSNF